MRGAVVRVVAVVATVIGLAGIGRSPAVAADTVCQKQDPLTGECTVWVEVPSTPGTPGEPEDGGPKDTGSGSACYWDGRPQGIFNPPPGPVPCTTEAGYWNGSCYIRLADPQPAGGDPAWEGHEIGDGAVYNCYQPQTGLLITIWSQDPPPNAGAGPTPRDVAQLAIKQMRLSAIRIGIAPEPGPDSIGLVGMPVWMWSQAPNDHTFGPISATASAGGLSVTATAKVLRVTWDMGDGTQVVCTTPGTPYEPSYGRKDSPDCGHTYTKSSVNEPDEAYTVTATSSWVITWSGAGQTGVIRLNGLNRSTQIRIGEAQVLVN